LQTDFFKRLVRLHFIDFEPISKFGERIPDLFMKLIIFKPTIPLEKTNLNKKEIKKLSKVFAQRKELTEFNMMWFYPNFKKLLKIYGKKAVEELGKVDDKESLILDECRKNILEIISPKNQEIIDQLDSIVRMINKRTKES